MSPLKKELKGKMFQAAKIVGKIEWELTSADRQSLSDIKKRLRAAKRDLKKAEKIFFETPRN